MRQTRIYQPGQYKTGDIVLLDEGPAHHLAVVLRARIGEKLFVFSDNQSEFKACINEIKRKEVKVLIGEQILVQRESPLQIHLAQAICKGDKMDWILQKGTELGVQQFTPIFSTRSAHEISDTKRLEKKLKHWQGILIHATEQSGRNLIPVLHPPQQLDQFLNTCNTTHKWILSPYAETSLRTCSPPQNSISVLVGPEGGWSEIELLSALKSDFLPVVLGPRILRTESAPIAVISILQFMSGDF